MLPQPKLEALIARHAEIESRLGGQIDGEEFVKFSRELSDLTPIVEAIRAYRAAASELSDLKGLIDDPATDREMREIADSERHDLQEKLEALETDIRIQLLPKDAMDERSVVMEIRAGTGGDEASLFAGVLFRMYERYAASQGWKVEIVSASEGAVGGYKEIIADITGRGVFAKLKYESGVHRVQRVPETEASGRIHTSAATVAVLPQAEDVDIDIRDDDLKIDTMRAQGAGGQHVNKTESAVRITHNPTGIVVQCQNDRSQHRNRDEAMNMLRARLYEFEMRQRRAEQDKVEAAKADIGWGHQIRSYVLDNSRIKDLRTNVEISNTRSVLDGDLDEFITASLKQGV